MNGEIDGLVGIRGKADIRILFCILGGIIVFFSVSERVNRYSLPGWSKRQGNDAFFILLWEVRNLYSHFKALESPVAEKPIKLTVSLSHGGPFSAEHL